MRPFSAAKWTGTIESRGCADLPGEVPCVTTSPAQASGRAGRRYWFVVVVLAILALSLLFSYDFTSGQFSPSLWSNLISGVQVSTLVGVVAILLLWVRSHDQ